MKQVRIVTHDDLDGTEGAETKSFGWLGEQYEIDLTEVHTKELAELLRPYIEAARPQNRKGQRRRPAGRSVRSQPGADWKPRTPREKRERTAALRRIRGWAIGQGYELKSQARIPYEVHIAYNEAHPDEQVPLADGGVGPAAQS